MLAGGSSATEALARLNDAIGLRARVLPMSDEPVRTWVSTRERGWSAFQEFMIASRAQGELDGLELRGVQDARPTAQVLESLARARAIIIGPSNPVISIGPILAVPGRRAAIADSPAPVIAVSPIVGGQVVKGPTAAFMRFAGRQCSAAGVAELYDGLLDGMVADEAIEGLPSLRIATLMDDAEGRRRVAEETLSFADSLSR